jgi:hypothetical protein
VNYPHIPASKGKSKEAQMKALQVVCACYILLVAAVSRADVASAPNVTVNYTNLEAPAAESIAKTLSAARAVYADAFGFDMPQMITARVTIGPDEPTRLYTDGQDRVFLSLPDKSKLAKPRSSGVFNLYGMCHELGHMAMYRTLKDRDWLGTAGAEGFAHYTGSVVVDLVYEKEGEKLWHDPYDYRADGMARLKRQIESADRSDIDRGAEQWLKLEQIIGRKSFPALFASWQAAKIDPTKADAALISELIKLHSDKKDALTAWWKSAAPILIEKTGASSLAKQTIAPNKLTAKPTILRGDDDAPDGKKSIAGSGHLRRFTAPDDAKPGGNADKTAATDYYLTAVHIHAARYGPAQPPPTQFDVALCDEQNRVIATFKFAYAAVPRAANAQWVRLALPAPTRLPKDFIVGVSFKPTASSGIFMSLDNSTSGQSQTGLPGKNATPLKDADWMIRAEVDRAK